MNILYVLMKQVCISI